MDFQSLDISIEAFAATYWPLMAGYAVRFAGAILLLIVGFALAGFLRRRIRSRIERNPRMDQTLGVFGASLVGWGIRIAVLIAVLGMIGVQMASFVAVLGALTLALGLAMQGALGNVAAGVMVMLFRPYKLGDWIETQGVSGTVKEINLFQTVLATLDNVQVLVPNSQAISGVIRNFSGYPVRRLDLRFSVSYEDDPDRAIAVIEETLRRDPRLFDNEDQYPVIVRVAELGASSVDIIARGWTASSDFWEARWDLTKQVKLALDREGLTIPYPHRVVLQRQEEPR